MRVFYSSKLEAQMQQVSIREARVLYEQGKMLYIQSSKMKFDNPWQPPYPISKELSEPKETFDMVVNSYKYYNCDGVRGLYPHFFIATK